MSGAAIQLAVQALKLFIHSLPYGSKFNIVSYGSGYEKMFANGSVEYNEENLEKADLLLNSFDANFGGTEIYKPLEDVLQSPLDKKLPR
jgi:hypothetical protein